jgi:uncharacterized protein (TIGR04222 family)
MNPFTLHGPAFLVFYALFAATVLLLLYVARRIHESGPMPRVELKDPYLLACLNGVPAEVIRVATAGLVDRGLLQLTGDTALTAPDVVPDFGHSPIERSLLTYFEGGASVSSAAQTWDVLAAASGYEHRLRSTGLLPDEEAQRVRRAGLALATAALASLGGVKLLVALSIGGTSIALLILLITGAILIAALIWNPYRTRRGDDYLESVRSLFENLRQRAPLLRPGAGTRELLWLTALFGTTWLPATAFAGLADVWRPPPRKKRADRGGSRGDGCGGSIGAGGCGGCGGGDGGSG